STVEHLPCKQKAMGSSPVASSRTGKDDRVERGNIAEGFPSGQREQTVNLPPLASEVRILPPPPREVRVTGGCSAAGRAPAFQAGCGGFESRRPLEDIARRGGEPVLT